MKKYPELIVLNADLNWTEWRLLSESQFKWQRFCCHGTISLKCNHLPAETGRDEAFPDAFFPPLLWWINVSQPSYPPPLPPPCACLLPPCVSLKYTHILSHKGGKVSLWKQGGEISKSYLLRHELRQQKGVHGVSRSKAVGEPPVISRPPRQPFTPPLDADRSSVYVCAF